MNCNNGIKLLKEFTTVDTVDDTLNELAPSPK